MEQLGDYDTFTLEEKKQYQLNSQEMNQFYTLPLDERQAVLDRLSGWSSKKPGSGSFKNLR